MKSTFRLLSFFGAAGLSLLALFSTSQAHAVYNPGWERPVMNARMAVTDGTFGFKDVKEMNITLTRRDGSKEYTGVEVRYENEAQKIVIERLKIVEVRAAGCGSVQYTATLANQSDVQGRRIHFTLIDHSKRLCKDYIRDLWVADIRMGYGWCGTGDSTAHLMGTPELINTPLMDDFLEGEGAKLGYDDLVSEQE